jgi:hypothetical protein
MNIITFDELTKKMEGWTECTRKKSGFSAAIRRNQDQTQIMKIQYLIRIGGGYFSVQLFAPHLKAGKRRLEHLFQTGQLYCTDVSEKRREKYCQKICSAVLGAVTHNFATEIRDLRNAAAHRITPALKEVFVCHTSGPFAMGVYIQENGGVSIASMQPTDLYMRMAEARPEAYVELIKACASIGIMHLDLNMGNILLKGGTPTMIDFGAVISHTPFTCSTELACMWRFEHMLTRFETEMLRNDEEGYHFFGISVGPFQTDFKIVAPFCTHIKTAAREVRRKLAAMWNRELPKTPQYKASVREDLYAYIGEWILDQCKGKHPMQIGKAIVVPPKRGKRDNIYTIIHGANVTAPSVQ